MFQQRNEAAFGVDIPDGGYTITNLFAAFAADLDVAEATANFASVNVPFAHGLRLRAHLLAGHRLAVRPVDLRSRPSSPGPASWA